MHTPVIPAGRARASEAAALAIWTVYAASILVPKLRTDAYSLGVEDLLALIGLPLVVHWIVQGKFRAAWRFNSILTVWMLIIGTGTLFGLLHSAYLLDHTVFPGEMWQYVKRMIYLLIGIRLVHSGLLQPGRALRVLVFVFIVMNVVGILQVFSPTADLLSVVYSQTETQLEALVTQEVDTTRNFSVAGFSTSWGGMSAFMFALSVACWAYGPRTHGSPLLERQSVFALLAVMSLLNVFFSGSRAAMLSVAVVVPCLVVLLLVGRGRVTKRLKQLALVGAATVASAALLLTVFAERMNFIQYRNEALVAAYFAGANRFGDAQTALGALSDLYYWLFGVSNAVQRAHYVEYGVEVEPVFLLVNYGVLGFLLRYFLLWLVVSRSWAMYRAGEAFHPAARALGAAGLLGMLSYVIFSSGYFFFHESVVGTLPWLVFGMVIGLPPSIPLIRAGTRLHRAGSSAVERIGLVLSTGSGTRARAAWRHFIQRGPERFQEPRA